MFPFRVVMMVGIATGSLLGLSLSPVMAADGKVRGRVVVEGQPLPSGRILFHLGNGQFVGSRVKDGRYAVDRVPVGTHQVTIEGVGVPAKYTSENTSALSTVVKEGTLDFDFDLGR